MWLGRPVAEVATAKGTRLFDAATGQALPAPTAREAEEIARLAWRGGARPAATVERIERASLEYRGTLLAWRVAFADPIPPASLSRPTPVGSRLSEPATLAALRLLWGLHIMDWTNHENFNTPWLLAFAIGGLALWLGGSASTCDGPKRGVATS
jgi:hypothetical protein